MAILQKQWADGDALVIRYEVGEDDDVGTAIFLSDANECVDREMTIAFKSEDIVEERKVMQIGKREIFSGSDGVFLDKNGDRFLVLKEGYKQD